MCGHEFTFDAAANDSSQNALCSKLCSPSSKVTSPVTFVSGSLTMLLFVVSALFALQAIVAQQHFCLHSCAWLSRTNFQVCTFIV